MIDHKLSQSEMDRIFNIRILIRLLKGIKLIEKFHIIYIISIWLLTIFIIRWFIENDSIVEYICNETLFWTIYLLIFEYTLRRKSI